MPVSRRKKRKPPRPARTIKRTVYRDHLGRYVNIKGKRVYLSSGGIIKGK